jgi:hypothetical protein
MTIDHGDEIRRGETGKRRLAEMRIGGEKMLRAGIDIGEVAATATGNADLLARRAGMIRAVRREWRTSYPRHRHR